MGIDTSMLAFPKTRELRIEAKRRKRLADDELERNARRAVRARDGARCAVPGCRERGTELHHIVRRSRSKAKRWSVDNLVYLCRAHHKLEHAGRIHISGNADDHVTITGAKKDLAFKL